MRKGTPPKAHLETELAALRQRVAALETEVAKSQQREAILRESEEHYRLLFHRANDGLTILYLTQDGKPSCFVEVNDEMCQRLGYTREELLQCSPIDILAPETVSKVPALVTEVMRKGRVLFETAYVAKDGRRIPVEINAHLSELDDKLTVLAIARDLTERKQAEAALREEADIAVALARVGQELITSLDTPHILDRLCRLTTEVVECDCSYTTLWDPQKNAYVTVAGDGDTPEQWEMIQALHIPSEMIIDLVDRLLRGEAVVEVDGVPPERLPIYALQQEVGITAALYGALRLGTQVVGTLSACYRGRHGFSSKQKRLVHDIAQLASFALANAKLLKELEDSNRLKEDFVGTMSHELRTPLNILFGYTEMLRDGFYGPLTAAQADILKRVEQNVRELQTLVTTTLDLSRLQSQRVPLTVQVLQVAELIEELVGETEQLATKPNVTLEWKIPQHLPPLRTDKIKLKMVLKNLLANALKFTEEGRVTLSVGSQGIGVTFSVADTGPGIAPEVLPFIFEPFRQGGNFSTRSQGGVGLGLYIVRQLLNLLGGTVAVDSSLGQGSTFRVWIPQEVEPR
jgi:PAS domain S-box-containing protein